jgi:preprotein translocase subunit SecE
MRRSGLMDKVLDYIRESRAELKKVTWPTKQQLWYSTIIVIVVTAVASAYLGLVDLILTGIFSKIIQ